MKLDNYYSEDNAGIRISRQQASRFAKEIAGDFNPIHDADAKRFCVPGDLLFALVLARYGLSQRMRFTFAGMVGDGVTLDFPDSSDGALDIVDDNGKKYLGLQREGDCTTNQDLIHDLTCSYVQFSGQTFPHILVPLMTEKQVMLNPERPLVIYESMAIDLDHLDIPDLKLELTDSNLTVSGKRGDVSLQFCLKSSGTVVGRGEKNMVLSGLRGFDQETVDNLVNDYIARKEAYTGPADE